MKHAWPIAYGQVISMMFFRFWNPLVASHCHPFSWVPCTGLNPPRCILLPTSSAQAQLEKKNNWAIFDIFQPKSQHFIKHIPFNLAKSGRYLPPKIPSIFQKSGSLTPPDSLRPCCYTFSVHFHREENPLSSQCKTEISRWLRSWTTQRPVTTQGCDSGGIVRTLSLVEGSESCRVCQLVKDSWTWVVAQKIWRKQNSCYYMYMLSLLWKNHLHVHSVWWCSAIEKNPNCTGGTNPTGVNLPSNRFPNLCLESLLRFSHQSSGAACCHWGGL